MKSRKTNIEVYADTIRLRGVERRAMKQSIVAFMEFHPLPKPEHGKYHVVRFIRSDGWLDIFSEKFRADGHISSIFKQTRSHIVIGDFVVAECACGQP